MTIAELEILAEKARNAGNATLLNRYLDASNPDNVLVVCRGSTDPWLITTPMTHLDAGDFGFIRSRVVSIIENEILGIEYEASLAA